SLRLQYSSGLESYTVAACCLSSVIPSNAIHAATPGFQRRRLSPGTTGRQRLKDHLKSELKLAGATAPERRVVIRDIRRGLRRAKTPRRSEWSVAACTIELGVAVLGLLRRLKTSARNSPVNFSVNFQSFITEPSHVW